MEEMYVSYNGYALMITCFTLPGNFVMEHGSYLEKAKRFSIVLATPGNRPLRINATIKR